MVTQKPFPLRSIDAVHKVCELIFSPVGMPDEIILTDPGSNFASQMLVCSEVQPDKEYAEENSIKYRYRLG